MIVYAVEQFGWVAATGTTYGMGDGLTVPSRRLIAVYANKSEAEKRKKQLDEKAVEVCGDYWLPGNPHLKPQYGVERYEPDNYSYLQSPWKESARRRQKNTLRAKGEWHVPSKR